MQLDSGNSRLPEDRTNSSGDSGDITVDDFSVTDCFCNDSLCSAQTSVKPKDEMVTLKLNLVSADITTAQ